MVKIIILRHGESEWNHENKFCGWIDVPLLSRGHQEAEHAGDLIVASGFHPIVMYTLKLTRSNQTGNIILAKLNRLWCDSYKSWRLNERHYGALQGQAKTKVCREFGQQKYDFVRRDYNGLPPPVEGDDPCVDERYEDAGTEMPRAESLKLVSERFLPYFRLEIFARNHQKCTRADRAILVVTHGLIVRAFIKHFTHVSDAAILKINVPTGIPIVFELDENMNVVGDYYYLDEEAAMAGIEKVRQEGRS